MQYILKGMTLWVRYSTDGNRDLYNCVNVSSRATPWVEINGANNLAMAISVWPYFNYDFRVRIVHPRINPGVDGR